MTMTNSCPHCGGSHPAEARFCPVTGKSLLQDPSSPQPTAPPSIFAYTPTEAASAIEKLLFMRRALQLISQGKLFRRAFAIVLRVLAVVSGLVGAVLWIVVWTLVADLPATGILGGVIFQMLFVVAIYMVVHTILVRAKDIAQLPESEFTVIPIVAIFLKLIGEVIACCVVFIAVAGGIWLWFAGPSAFWSAGPSAGEVLQEEVPSLGSEFGPPRDRGILQEVAPFLPRLGEGSFVSGVLLMAVGVPGAFFTLVFFYLLSELVVVWVAIAKNTEVTRHIAEQYDKTKVTP